jgi:hypothetical protein
MALLLKGASIEGNLPLFSKLPTRGVFGSSDASAEKFSEIKALRFMQEGGISIRPVLQVVARVSAESTDLVSSEGISS